MTERIVIVNKQGVIRRYAEKKHLQKNDIVAVELVLICAPDQKKIALFYRGDGAGDMHDHWALESGKVTHSDLSPNDGDGIGKKLSLAAFTRAAVREIAEELDFAITADRLRFVHEFYMAEKRLFFTLLALSLGPEESSQLCPNQSEISRVRWFSLDELRHGERLGDALIYAMDTIESYLRQVLGDPHDATS